MWFLGSDCNPSGDPVDVHHHYNQHHDHDAGAQGSGQGGGQNSPVEMFHHILHQIAQGLGLGQGG